MYKAQVIAAATKIRSPWKRPSEKFVVLLPPEITNTIPPSPAKTAIQVVIVCCFWKSTVESTMVQIGVVAKTRLAFPAKVASMPKMKSIWYTRLHRRPRITICAQWCFWGRGIGPLHLNIMSRVTAARGNLSALRARGSISVKTTFSTEKLIPHIIDSATRAMLGEIE